MTFKNKLTSFVNKMQNKLSKNLTGITTSKGMLHNKILLYVVFIFSLLNLFILANTGNYTYVVVFILIGFLSSFFSKNMLVILLLALILTNILKYGSSLNEGFEEGAKGKKDEDEVEEGAKGKKDEDDEGFEEGAKGEKGEDDEAKEGLDNLKDYADKLLTTISSLNKQIDKFSKMN